MIVRKLKCYRGLDINNKPYLTIFMEGDPNKYSDVGCVVYDLSNGATAVPQSGDIEQVIKDLEEDGYILTEEAINDLRNQL